MIKKVILCSFLVSPLLADEEATRHILLPKTKPWFTGPLLAPSGYTTPAGHYSLEPYLYFKAFTGSYDHHWKVHSRPNFYSTIVQLQAKIGLLNWIDFQFFPQVFYNETQGRHYSNIGDLPLAFNFQLLDSKFEDRWPAMKLALRANLPIGKYQHLKGSLKRTDAIGFGAWHPGANVIFSKLWNITGIHYLEARLSFNYWIGTAVHVKGRNTYGGDSKTHGTAYPGNTLTIDGAVQYNLSQRWALACDLYYEQANKNRFSGKTAASMKRSSREQFSLAPALEYNWNDNFGVIGGVWFTFAGRNAARFTNGVIAFSIYI